MEEVKNQKIQNKNFETNGLKKIKYLFVLIDFPRKTFGLFGWKSLHFEQGGGWKG